MAVELNDLNISELLYNPAGGVTRAVEYAANVPVLELCRRWISRPWPKGRGPFPPPGPPYARYDDPGPRLRDSITVVSVVGPAGPEFDIVPTAIHRGWNYGEILKGRGYRFMPPEFYL